MSPLQWALGSVSSIMYGSEHDPPLVADVQRATYSDHVVSRLHHFDTKDVPPSARVDPSLAQRVAPPFKYTSIFEWCYVVARKCSCISYPFICSLLICFTATEIAGELVAHHIWGPRRKSWGFEMTIISTVMRGAAAYSHIASLVSSNSSY